MAAVREHFPTYFTVVRLLTCMSSYVCQQNATVREHFPAGLTGIRPLACVDSHADSQSAPLSEAFPTHFARMRLLTCVGSLSADFTIASVGDMISLFVNNKIIHIIYKCPQTDRIHRIRE